jgi:hypothetical protein
MHLRLARIILWLFVIDLGIAFGAGIYELKVEAPRWVRNTKVSGFDGREARAVNSGQKFWTWVTTIPLTVLTVASLAAVRFGHIDHKTKRWWAIAAFAAVGERLIAFAYSIPTLMELMAGADPNGRATAFKWAQLGWMRQILLLVAWLAALRAFACFSRSRRRVTEPQIALPGSREPGSALSELKLQT